MFGQKRLSSLDIKSIVLMIEDFNRTYPGATNNQKEYFLANRLRDFGIKVDRSYSYGCIPRPPLRDNCYTPTVDNRNTTPPTEDQL